MRTTSWLLWLSDLTKFSFSQGFCPGTHNPQVYVTLPDPKVVVERSLKNPCKDFEKVLGFLIKIRGDPLAMYSSFA